MRSVSPWTTFVLGVSLAISFSAAGLRAESQTIVPVSNVAELYAAVDDTDNAGALVVLARGHYQLIDDPSTDTFDHKGRLELQPGMTLQGQSGEASRVVIDASKLSAAALTGPNGLTGAIRVGRGDNAIEWLTVTGAAAGSAAIETDLVEATAVEIRISHVVATGGMRGIDVRNLGAASAGRELAVLLEDNDLHHNTAMVGQGFRIVNATSADGARIDVTLRGNRSHQNNAGCQVANLNTSDATITIDSQEDVITNNTIGCIFFAGNGNTTTDANDNTVTYTAHGGRYQNNRPGTALDDGAIVAVAGQSLQTAGNASGNTLRIELWDTKFSGNETKDIRAWGARFDGALPAGTHNTTEITLHGVSEQATFSRDDSDPDEPAGTNTATVTQ